MRISSKGQVTIPQELRELSGLLPTTEIEFKIVEGGILIEKAKTKPSFGNKLINHMRGRSDAKMSTDEIMNLTRE